MPTIDYIKIADAILYYERFGYQYIDAPWLVSKEAMEITSPKGPRFFSTFAGNAVASGEQSFLEIRNELKPGKYQCATPCFRDEVEHDDLRLQRFFKVELIDVLGRDHGLPIAAEDVEKYVLAMADDAFFYFSKYFRPEYKKTDIGIDIEINGIEVGSYGYRRYEDFEWIYGTGVAEPRLSQVVNQAMAKKYEK
jgi:hypothetical protein